MEHKNIAFIGAGNMVKAIVSGLVAGATRHLASQQRHLQKQDVGR